MAAAPSLSLAGRWNARGRSGLAYRVLNRLEKRRFRRSLPFALPSNAVIVRRDSRLTVVLVDPEATGRSAARTALERALAVCVDAGVDYFLVPTANEIASRIAIPDEQWDAFTDALAFAGRRELIGVVADGVGSLAGLVDARGAHVAAVFSPVVTRSDGRQLGRRFACQVERWTSEGTHLVAPARNGSAGFVDRQLAAPVTVRRDGADVRTLDVFTRRHILAVDFPVDVVYLWVDGGDPAWQQRKSAALAALGEPPADSGATADERFRDGGELKYSLRSLAQFAPWVRRVFLVTDGQLPSWLDADEPRLTLVDHRELFGSEGTLPTFNSHAIGARLHHIDGLAEHYLYLNDDVFFGHDVTPADFFEANGVSKFYLSRLSLGLSGDDRPAHESARRNVAELIERDFGVVPTNIFYHSPVPQRRSTMDELERRYPDEFRTTWHNQFRAHTDIEPNSWLHHYAGYLLGRAVPASISYTYVQLGDAKAATQLRELDRLRDRAVFCINDHVDATEAERAEVAAWLERYFPMPGPFEKR